SGYPWSGPVDLQVRSAPPSECGLAVRIPGWSGEPRFSLNGSPVSPGPEDGGYLVVRRRWYPGDVLRCDLDTPPRLTYPSGRMDALRGTVAVERGPLVYCFEQADQPGDVSVEDLALSPGDLAARDAEVPGVGGTVVAEAGAVPLPPVPAGGLPYS